MVALDWVSISATEDREVVQVAGEINPKDSTPKETRDLGVAELAAARNIPNKQFTMQQLLAYLHAHDFPTLSERTLIRRMGEWRDQNILVWYDSAKTLNSFDPHDKYHPGAGNEEEIVAAAVTQAGGIVEFMTKMVKNESITVQTKVPGATKTEDVLVNFTILKEWWKHPSVRRKLSTILRDANKGSHEWIPCQLIMDVIERAADLGTYQEGVKWVYLQHHLRSDTSWVIFKPTVSTQQHIELHGHPGAIYKDMGPGIDREPQTEGSPQFHVDCCKAFSQQQTVNTCINQIEGVFEKWVWDGKPLNRIVDNSLYAQAKGGDPIYKWQSKLETNQQQHYRDMRSGRDGFEKVRARVHAI